MYIRTTIPAAPVVEHTGTAAALTNVAATLDGVIKTLTPDPKDPKAPTLQWGDDLGVFLKLEAAVNDLDTGRNGFSSTFTRHQAGPLIDALTADSVNVRSVRDAALAIEEGKALGAYAPAPQLNPNAVQQLTQAAADCRAALALLQNPGGSL